jgi:peptidoglycan hydrolase-like protein with peptidoglycan-binding domain
VKKQKGDITMKKLFVICVVALCVLPLPVSAQRFTREIKLGANGADVKALQQRLLSLGFSQIGPTDGAYGPRTEKAIREIQKFLGFKSTNPETEEYDYSAYVNEGKVTRELWDIVFNEARYGEFLRIISTVASYDYEKLQCEIEVTDTVINDFGTIFDVEINEENFERQLYMVGHTKIFTDQKGMIKRIYTQTALHDAVTEYKEYTFYDTSIFFIIYGRGGMRDRVVINYGGNIYIMYNGLFYKPNNSENYYDYIYRDITNVFLEYIFDNIRKTRE